MFSVFYFFKLEYITICETESRRRDSWAECIVVYPHVHRPLLVVKKLRKVISFYFSWWKECTYLCERDAETLLYNFSQNFELNFTLANFLLFPAFVTGLRRQSVDLHQIWCFIRSVQQRINSYYRICQLLAFEINSA